MELDSRAWDIDSFYDSTWKLVSVRRLISLFKPTIASRLIASASIRYARHHHKSPPHHHHTPEQNCRASYPFITIASYLHLFCSTILGRAQWLDAQPSPRRNAPAKREEKHHAYFPQLLEQESYQAAGAASNLGAIAPAKNKTLSPLFLGVFYLAFTKPYACFLYQAADIPLRV